MTVAVIVHVESDRPYVDSLHTTLECARLVACVLKPKSPIMAFEARLPLILVWSRRAHEQQAAAAFAAMARAHRGQTILCVSDDCPLPGALERLPAAVVNGSPRSSMFPGGLIAALTEAQRRQIDVQANVARVATMARENSRRAFTEGVTRGLAGTVAIFGVGGTAALGVEQLSGTDAAQAHEGVGYVVAAEQTADTPDDGLGFESGPVFAEADVIFVDSARASPAPAEAARLDPAQADVPLAQPSPDEVAAQQAANFVTDQPLEVWTPSEGLFASVAPLGAISDLAEGGWAPVVQVLIHDSGLDATLRLDGLDDASLGAPAQLMPDGPQV